MAIHIDIYAHLKKSQLIKEGEQLKKYVESLENDANKRLEKGAQGRSQKLIRLNDQQAKSYDQLINASDAYVSSLNAEKAAEKALQTLKKTKQKDIKSEEAHALALAAAEREVVSAQKDRAYQAQRLTAAANTQTRAVRDLNEENEAHTKNARQVGALLTANRTRMVKLSAATNGARREMESLHTSNQAVVKGNKAVARGMDQVSAATEKTAAETKKLNEMVKEGVNDYKKLRDQSDRVKNAHKAEKKAIKGVTEGVKDLVQSYQLSRVVVDANQKSLKGYSQQAQQSAKQIKGLHKSNAALIDGNVKLARSFAAAKDATKAASREHQEYKRLVAGGASQDVLRKKAERVGDAYQKQARDVRAAGKALNEALTFRGDRDTFIRSQSNSMRDYARDIADASSKVDNLRNSHESQIRSNARLSSAFNSAAGSVRRAAAAQKDYDRLVSRGAGRDDLQRAAEKASEAYAKQRRDVDEATNALHRHNKEKRAEGIRGLTGGPGEYASRNIAALTPLGRVNAGVGLPLLGLAGNFAEAGVTASQSIALLPALATSAAAAIGTLAIGFHGFFQTVGDMGDPKKFSEGLAMLAPNAQQAALQIKALVDGPLGDLKRTVQDDLFANVAPQIGAVAETLGPQMSNLFGGLSKEFNKAFIGITNVLMLPESQASLSGIVDGIVVGFQHLLPMLSPLTQAFLTLSEVGASFLPQLGDSFTNAATAFNNFVQGAAADGSLQNFIQKGIDAAGVLIDWIKRLGVAIYQEFGNKSPEEFTAALDGALSVIKGILSGIQTLSDVINALTPVFSTVFGGLADAVGGASNLAYIFVGIWTGQKLYSGINAVAGLFGKSIGGALTGLVGTAEKSAGGITAALAKVKVPPALLALLGPAGAVAAIGGGAAMAAGVGHEGVTERKGGSVDWLPDWLNPGVIFNPENWIDNALGKFDTPTDVPPGSAPSDPTGTGAGTTAGNSRFPGASDLPGSWMGGTTPAGGPFTPLPLPSNAGKYEFSNIPIGQFQGAQWQVPAGATDLPVDYDNLGKQGFYRPDPLKIMDRQSTVDNKRQTAEEARSKYLDLVAAGNTRQEELNKASNDVIQAEQGWLSSMRDLKEAERGEFEDLTSQMDKFGQELRDSLGDMGAALDPDLGISKGLSGMADNLVRFVGSLALAPSIAQLKKVQYDAGFPNGEGAGMGLMGILTAPWAKPTRPMNKDNADAYRAQYGIENYGLNTITPGGPVPVDPAAYINGPSKLRKGEGVEAGLAPAAASVAQILTGMFPGITDIGGRQDRTGPQMHPNGRALDVMTGQNAATGDAIAKFLDANYQALGVQSYIWRDIGKNLTSNEGGGPGTTYTAGGHGGASGTDAGSHVHIQFAKGAQMPAGMPGVPAGAAPASGGTGGIPLVQNPDGTWTSSDPEWAKLIKRESGGNPGITQGVQDANSGGNEATGLFQIAKGTWESNGGLAYGANAKDASPQQQAEIAAKIFREQGGAPWGSGAGQNFGRENEALLRAGLTGSPTAGGMPVGMPGIPTGGSAAFGSVPSGSGTPVFVTNWPGGGGFGGGAPGGAPGASPMGVGPGGGTPHLTGGTPGPGAPHITGAAPGPGGGVPGGSAPGGSAPGGSAPGGGRPGGGPAGPAPLAGKGAGGNFLDAWKDAITGKNPNPPGSYAPGQNPMLGPLGLTGTGTGTSGPANLPQWENAGGMANWISKALTGGPNKLPWDDLSRYGIDVSGAGRAFGNLIRDGDPNVANANASTPIGSSGPALDALLGSIRGGGGGPTGGDPLAAFAPWGAPNAADRVLSVNSGAAPPGMAPRPGDSIFAGMPNADTSVDAALRGITTPGGAAPANGYNPGILTPGAITNYQGTQAASASAQAQQQAAMDAARAALGLNPSPVYAPMGGADANGNRPSPGTFWKLPGFAKGGEVPIMAHSGEHVLTRSDVAAMGGQQGVMDFRNQLQSFGTGGPIDDMLMGGGGNKKGAEPGETTKTPKPNKFLDAQREAMAGVNTQAPANPLTAPLGAPLAVPPAAGPVGAPVPAAAAPAATPTPIGAQVDPNTGIGGGFQADLSSLAGAASAAFPGAGAAAQVGIKLAERGIEYAGQAAAIGVQGLMETFLPTGGSELANNNWFTRIAGAVAGSAPAISNLAGGKSNPEGGPGGGLPPGPTGIPGLGPSTPEQIAGQSMAPAAQAAPPAPNVTNFNYTANGVKGAEEAFPDAARAWEARPGQR